MKNEEQQNTLNFDESSVSSDKVSQNICEQMPQQKRKPLWKRALLAVTYTLLVCAIAATSTWGIQRAFASDNVRIVYVNGDDTSNEIGDNGAFTTPSTKRTEVMEKFDRYISFGRMTSKELMGSYLLSEADKDIISHAVEHSKQKYDSPFYLSAFFGEIDGVDYIYIEVDWNFVYDCDQCKTIFPSSGNFRGQFFKSDLEYSLNDVLTAFENMIGEPLTDEHLCALSNYLGDLWDKTTGVNMDFRCNDYWTSTSLGKKTDKYQWETTIITERWKGDFSDAKVVELDNGYFEITVDGGHGTIYANEIISMSDDELVFSFEVDSLACYSEIFYVLYNNQFYVINRAYMLTGQMYYQEIDHWFD